MAKLVRWTPRTAGTQRNLSTFDRMFDEMWNTMYGANNARYNTETARPVLRPAMDVVENEHAVIVRIDLPGIAPEDVNIEIDGDLLTINGELQSVETDDEKAERYTYRERRFGAFKRSLRLADTLDTENAEATFENGVLALTLPKLPEAQPKRITVQTTR